MALQQGLSGLLAQSRALEVIGNNIANASTIGAKASRAEFADLYSIALGDGGTTVTEPGVGATVSNIAQQFNQGAVKQTENPLDLAINGNGFFQLRAPNGEIAYTRNGQFKLDASGNVVNAQGYKLLGYEVGTGNTELTSLKLPNAGIPPSQTSNIEATFNLDSKSGPTESATAPNTINFNDTSTYNNASSVSVYDSKGNAVSLTYYFQKTANPNEWNVYASANGTSLSSTGAAPALVPRPVAKLNFSTNGGTLASGAAAPAAGDAGTITYFDANFTAPGTTVSDGRIVLPDIPSVALSSGNAGVSNSIGPLTLDIAKATQFSSVFGVTDVGQDGSAPGQLTGITFDRSGNLTARYSNGKTSNTARLELATFRNLQGLIPVGDNAWLRSPSTGDPIVGSPDSGNFGDLQSSALEQSNIDLTSELVEMISVQRAYQANATTIKTQDQVLAVLMTIKQ